MEDLLKPKNIALILIVYVIVTGINPFSFFCDSMPRISRREKFTTDYSSFGSVGERVEQEVDDEEEPSDSDAMGKIFMDSKINTSTGCDQNKIPFLSSNLLPKEDPRFEDDFSEFAPKASDLTSANFLQSDRMTMSSNTTRNANVGLRSEPPNPRNVVTPWMMSTIEPDLTRKPLEIGSN